MKLAVPPALEPLKLRWQARASVAYDVPFTDHSARFRWCEEALAGELEKVFALRTDSELTEYLETFACDYARFCGRRYGVGTASGTSALSFALLALGVEPGDEVLVPRYSYVATSLAVEAVGAVPVREPSQRVKGEIVAHLYGAMQPPARRDGLFLLEDACQAHAVTWNGRPAGSFGEAAAFSFNTNKLLSGLGNGGLFVTDDAALLEKVRRMRDPESGDPLMSRAGRTPGYLDPVQAACVRAQLSVLPRALAHRRALAAVYQEAFPVDDPPELGRSWHAFVIEVERRDELRAYLKGRGIEARDGYATGELCLPLGLHLEEEHVRRVIAAVRTAGR